MPHILVAGKLHEAGLALLRGNDAVSWDYVPDADPVAYLEHLPKAEGLVLRTQPLTVSDIAGAPQLGIVSRHGVGYDAVDAAALDARGIPLAIVGDVNSRTVAEHAMMHLLAASRRLGNSTAALKRGDWAGRNDFEPREVDGKTLLIIGYGRIGRRLAGLAQAFGMRVMAHDPFLGAADFTGAEAAPDLNDAFAVCDLISVHVPMTDGALIGAAEIARMKPGVVIVNTARGGVVDEAALLEGLNSGQVGAAGLDVLTEEPPDPKNPLLHHPNALVTPHNAGLTQECAARMALVSVQNVLDHFNGALEPALVVNLKGRAG